MASMGIHLYLHIIYTFPLTPPAGARSLSATTGRPHLFFGGADSRF